MPPSQKRPRIWDFRNDSYASQRAIVALLSQVRDEGFPASLSRSTFQRQRDELARTVTAFGPILQ